MEDLKNIVESILFVTEEPLTVERIKRIVSDADSAEIRDALQDLTQEYDARQGGFYLREVAGGFQFRTRSDYTEWVKRLLSPKPPRLSRAALETLAIIAYKQPVIRSDVEHLRGVDCGGVLRVLMERNLIRVLGRKNIPGRPLIYGTTRRFLEVFDLRDLKDLPSPQEIELVAREKFDLTDDSESTDSDEQAPPGEEAGEAELESAESLTEGQNSAAADQESTGSTGLGTETDENSGRKNA
jgi:segregation and condensation protein B